MMRKVQFCLMLKMFSKSCCYNGQDILTSEKIENLIVSVKLNLDGAPKVKPGMPGVSGLLCDERGCPIYNAGPVSIKLLLGTLFGLQMLGGFAHKLGHQLAWILEFKKFILNS